MSRTQILILTALSMIAFAGNSLLCRMALRHTGIDAASFTSIRILSGALVLWLIIGLRGERIGTAGSWYSALALFTYAAGFSFAYVSLPAATGALLLFGAVQATMISYGLWKGEQLRGRQVAGLIIAFSGLFGLLLQGLSAPPLHGSILMLAAGIAWGIYCAPKVRSILPESRQETSCARRLSQQGLALSCFPRFRWTVPEFYMQ
jgi:drug/metabolite transporter (DMT)-like permease